MALDTVELIIAIEEEFALEISNAEAPTLVRLGIIHDYLVQTLKRRGECVVEDQVWERLGMIVMDQLGVLPEQLTRDAHIVYDLGAD